VLLGVGVKFLLYTLQRHFYDWSNLMLHNVIEVYIFAAFFFEQNTCLFKAHLVALFMLAVVAVSLLHCIVCQMD